MASGIINTKKLPNIGFGGLGVNDDSKCYISWTGNSFVITYYTTFVDSSNNYGHQVVFSANGLRYDSITNGDLTTIWSK